MTCHTEFARYSVRSCSVLGREPQPSIGIYKSHETINPMSRLPAIVEIAFRQPHFRKIHNAKSGIQINAVSLTCAARIIATSPNNGYCRCINHKLASNITIISKSLWPPTAVAISANGFHNQATSAAGTCLEWPRATMLAISAAATPISNMARKW